MGTKRPSCTLFDTSSNINTSDRKLQPSGNVSRDLSPRPALAALSERERDGGHENNWRREREAEKIRDKSRPNEMDPRDRYYDRERAPVPRPREGDRGRREREWRAEDMHSRNGRPLSSIEKEAEREVERGMRKGDTFPRIRKNSRERDRGTMAAGEMDDERGEWRQRDRQRREEMDAQERERDREWTQQREKVRERDEARGQRPKDERQNARRRHAEEEKGRERYQEFQDGWRDPGDTRDRKEREATRKRDKLRPDFGHREGRVPSPRRRRDWEEDERRRKREGRRDTRSEGDSDEREMRRDRERERHREELQYQQSRSEGDKRKSAQREREEEEDRRRHRERYRVREEEDRTRRWEEGKNRDRAEARPPPRQADRDTREDWRRHQRYRDHQEGGGVREVEPGPHNPASRGRQPASERAPPPRAQSSGEWSTTESDRDVEEQRASGERRQREKKRSERAERERREQGGAVAVVGGRQEQRRMWFEPRWGENSREDDCEDKERRVKSESREGTERERQRVKDEGFSGERARVDQKTGTVMDEDEGPHLSSSDGAVEESDGEEDAGSGGGSETGWKRDGERLLSGEEGFVTVSSGGDDEEHFQDCREFWDGSEEDAGDQSKTSKYVFCVIGQSLPRSATEAESTSPATGAEIENPYDEVTWEPPQDNHGPPAPPPRREHKCPVVNSRDSKKSCDVSDEDGELQDTELQQGTMTQEKENPYAEIGPIKRDSQTERLLTEWRQKNRGDGEKQSELQPSPLPANPYEDCIPGLDFEQMQEIQPILDGINSGAMSPEEVEAIRIRLSGAWSISQEPKRHSQAPHLKWAKNVVREILGHSEEQQVLADSKRVEEEVKEVGEVEEKAPAGPRGEQEEIQGEIRLPPVDQLRVDEELEEELEELDTEEEEVEEEEGLRGTGQKPAHMHAEHLTAMHGNAPTHTPLRTTSRRVEGGGGVASEGPDKETGATGEREEKDEKEEEKEADMFLAVSNTLYKPSSCPILSYDTKSQLLPPPAEGSGQSTGESEEDRQGVESGEGAAAEDEEEDDEDEEEKLEEQRQEGQEAQSCRSRKQAAGKMSLKSTCSFRDQGPSARLRRRGIRKTAEKRKKRGSERVDVTEEEEGVGRDRRTRIFSTTDDEDDRSKSWGEVEFRSVLDTIERRKRNSKFFNAAQLYQQYSEAAQNFEILRQARSDVVSVGGEAAPSSAPSPPPARRPLPPLPASFHHQPPQPLSYTGSVTSVQSLPLPQPPRSEGRPSSPRLSVSLGQSSSLWRELPGVRNSSELEELSEDQRRLQEVRFEVVTSEASYCRSLDIVVEHFVKSKQLGALLTTQDRNWLFSRLADVRAISHSFLSKLEERVESNIISFTVCDIIARQCQRFRMVYVPYLTNQSYQDATYQRLMNENPGFKRIVEKLETSPVCQRLPFRSFLVLPFQRITRIKLLVQNIVKRTTPGTPQATQAIKSLKLIEKLIQEGNDSITQMKSIESLVSLSAKVDFECRTLPLISQSRRLVREGLVTELIDFSLKDTERNIYVHLFNDYLLLSLQKEGGRFTVIDHSPVSDLRVENCRVKLHSLQKNLFRLHMAHKALLLRTDTQSDKLRWISALSRPHPEMDFSAAQDFPQMQCVRSFVAQQPDELSLEKADIILVHQQSSDHWVEGTRLSDRHRGWVPESHLETISNSKVRNRNLTDAQKLTTATAAV